MVEFPITKFELNDFFVMNARINDSKFYLKMILKIIENFYDKNLKYKKRKINLNLSKLNIVTDFIYGKAIYKLPTSYKKLSKRCRFQYQSKKLPKKDIDTQWGTRIKDSDLIKFPILNGFTLDR